MAGIGVHRRLNLLYSYERASDPDHVQLPPWPLAPWAAASHLRGSPPCPLLPPVYHPGRCQLPFVAITAVLLCCCLLVLSVALCWGAVNPVQCCGSPPPAWRWASSLWLPVRTGHHTLLPFAVAATLCPTASACVLLRALLVLLDALVSLDHCLYAHEDADSGKQECFKHV